LTTLGAVNRNFDALPHSGRLSRRDCSQSFVLRLFAGLAAFWFVLQTFVVKENLLTTGPDKILTTVNALN
jgi:hypothetical protein